MTRPGAQFRNPRGVVAALIVGAAMWVCGCGVTYALYRILAH